ncbi:MAG: hypothetical protein ACE5GW_13085 [Planctomycetota bacterium]
MSLRIAATALLFALCMGGTALAQASGSLAIGTVPSAPGSTAVVPVSLTINTGANGFSGGVTHDPSILTLLSVDQGADLLATQGGTGAQVFLANLSPAGGVGFTIGCLIDLLPPFELLAPGVNLEVMLASYQVADLATPGSTPLQFTGLLGNPPVDILLVLESNEVIPTVTNGAVTILATLFIRADCTGDGVLNLVDVVRCLEIAFGLVATECPDVADVDDDGLLDIPDAMHLLNYLYMNGPVVPAPFPLCGGDASADALPCTASQSGC